MTRYRVVRVLLTVVVGLLGIFCFNFGIHFLFGMVTGQVLRSNYPGVLLSIPAMVALLPIVLIAIWKERVGNKLLIWVGVAGLLGTLTTPCAWQLVNRNGFFNSVISFCVVALVGWGLASNAKSTSKLWPFI